MTKLLFASLLTAAVMFAQATGGSTDTGKTPKAAGKKATKEKKGGKKGGKNGKKSTDTTTTPPQK